MGRGHTDEMGDIAEAMGGSRFGTLEESPNTASTSLSILSGLFGISDHRCRLTPPLLLSSIHTERAHDDWGEVAEVGLTIRRREEQAGGPPMEVPGKILIDQVLEPRGRVGLVVREGEILRVVDLEGQQVADLVCFCREDTAEKLSVHVTFMVQGNIYITKGRSLLSNQCRKLMTITEDSCGKHDLLAGSCNEGTNRFRYGIANTPNCRTNLEEALRPFGIPLREIPYSFNVFMNVPVQPNGSIATREPISKAGDFIDLQAETDLIVGISNCPDDRGVCNGGKPTKLRIMTYSPA